MEGIVRRSLRTAPCVVFSPIERLGGDVAQGRYLGARESEGSQIGIGNPFEVFGPRKTTAGESQQKTPQNRLGRLAMQLLVGHGSDQRLERSSLRLWVQSAGTDPLDESTHDRIRIGQVL
jgi:hypothetical protein